MKSLEYCKPKSFFYLQTLNNMTKQTTETSEIKNSNEESKSR